MASVVKKVQGLIQRPVATITLWCCDEHTATLDFYMFGYQKPSPALFLSIFFLYV